MNLDVRFKLENILYEITVCEYILKEFNGMDFRAINCTLSNDFDKTLIYDLSYYINEYLDLIKNEYF